MSSVAISQLSRLNQSVNSVGLILPVCVAHGSLIKETSFVLAQVKRLRAAGLAQCRRFESCNGHVLVLIRLLSLTYAGTIPARRTIVGLNLQ